ncbi:MAG: hypothetical protein ACRDA5_02380 [Clostridium sp.]
MAYKREEVNGTSPIDIKKINDNMRGLWAKVFGDINFSDTDKDLKKKILTQWIPVQGEGNFDIHYPMTIRFFIPNNTSKIVGSNFNLYCERYRMDSGVASGGGSVSNVDIAMSMGSTNVNGSVDGNGDSTSYVRWWGNYNPDSGMIITDGSGKAVAEKAKSRFFDNFGSNSENHFFRIDDNAPYGHYVDNNGWGYRFMPVYRGVDNGQLWVDMACFQHSHLIPGHGHNFSQSPHSHTASGKVSIDEHEHDLKEGIKISSQNAMGVGIKINGNLIANMDSVTNNNLSNINIAQHIKIGQWNLIECSTVNLARLTVYGTVEIEIIPR